MGDTEQGVVSKCSLKRKNKSETYWVNHCYTQDTVGCKKLAQQPRNKKWERTNDRILLTKFKSNIQLVKKEFNSNIPAWNLAICEQSEVHSDFWNVWLLKDILSVVACINYNPFYPSAVETFFCISKIFFFLIMLCTFKTNSLLLNLVHLLSRPTHPFFELVARGNLKVALLQYLRVFSWMAVFKFIKII